MIKRIPCPSCASKRPSGGIRGLRGALPLGIANYSARVKIKEIGIRKVLRADTAGLAAILSQTIRASLANPVESLKHEE